MTIRFCRYCGKRLKEGEVCNCRAGNAAVNNAGNTASGSNTGAGGTAAGSAAVRSSSPSGAAGAAGNVQNRNIQSQNVQKGISETAMNRAKIMSQVNAMEENVKELKYTNTIKRRISFTYAAAVIISLIVGFMLTETFFILADVDASGSSFIIPLIIVEVFIVGLGCRIADFLVARLGMQMEMSYNLNITRIYLKNIEEIFSKLYESESK